MVAGVTERKELPFEVPVYKERVRRLREGMSARGVDVLVLHSPENIFYLCGYNTPGYYYGYQSIVVSLESDPFMVLRRVEESNVIGRSWLSNWYIYGDTDDPIDIVVQSLKKEKLDGKRIGLNKDTRFLTPREFEKMKAGLPDATFVDGHGLVEDLRRIKSDQEIGFIRRAVKASEAGMSAAVEATVEGNTEDDVAAAAYQAIIMAGSEYPGMPPLIAAGYRAGLAHTTWEGHKRIERGDAVMIEIPGTVNRYHGVFARAVIIGEPSARFREIEKVVREAGDALIAAVRPGITAAEADKAHRDVIIREGYGDHFLHRSAYGLGIAFPPHWDEGAILSLKPGNELLLEPNMVFHMVSALYFYAEACVTMTETIRVTETGSEKMTNFPRKLIVN